MTRKPEEKLDASDTIVTFQVQIGANWGMTRHDWELLGEHCADVDLKGAVEDVIRHALRSLPERITDAVIVRVSEGS